MRILQVVRSFGDGGGVEHVAFELHRAFRDAGADTRVLTASTDAACPEADLVAPWLGRIGALRHGRYFGRFLAVPLFTLAATWRLRRPSGSRRMVVSHGDTLAGDVCVIHAVNKASLHEKRQAGKRLWRLNPTHAWVGWRDRRMLEGGRFRRLVAVSARVRDELQRFYRVPPDRIALIPNGVNVDRFRPGAGDRDAVRREFGIPAAARLLLFAGHEFGRKGLAFVIGALPLLPPDVHLLVAGGDDPAPYRAQAARLGVAGRVVFAGARADLPRLYPAGDAFVFPTYYESFALVCMEAMASGLPLFATRAGGIEDYLEDGGNGYFISRDPAAIAAKLQPALDDPAALRRLGAAARRTAERYAWPLIAERYLDLLRTLAAEPARPGPRAAATVAAVAAAVATLLAGAAAAEPRCTSDFARSVGVNTHLEATDTQYRDGARVAKALAYLGVTEIRDAAPRSPEGLARYRALLAADGRIRFDLIVMGDPRRLLPAIDALAPSVRAVEGPNEVDRTPVRLDGRTGPEAVAADQALIHGAVTSDPMLNPPGGERRVPVLNFSLANQNRFAEFGDLAAHADLANVHAYARKGVPPFWMLGPTVRKVRATLDRPAIVTESNYPTLLQPDGNGVSETVQAKWVLAILLGDFRAGIAATYLYQLLDGTPDPSGREFEAHFGLFRSDWTPKPAATGLRNLLDVLGGGAPCRDGAPPPRYRVALPNHGFDLPLRRPDGTFALVLWAEPAIWDAANNRDVPAAPFATTVAFEGAHDLRLYDPLAGTEPVESHGAADRIAVTLTDRPLVLLFR